MTQRRQTRTPQKQRMPLRKKIGQTTKKKYEIFELLSALQKDIRRGKERDALFWAIKISELNSTALWNRLETIASEDIGPANPGISQIIIILRTLYEKAITKGKDSYRLYLAHAIIELAWSEKSRVVDDLVWDVFWEIEHENLELEIPDYAYGPHTGRGTIRKWLTEGCKLKNESELPNSYKELAIINLMSGKKLLKHYPKNHPSNITTSRSELEKPIPRKPRSKQATLPKVIENKEVKE